LPLPAFAIFRFHFHFRFAIPLHVPRDARALFHAALSPLFSPMPRRRDAFATLPLFRRRHFVCDATIRLYYFRRFLSFFAISSIFIVFAAIAAIC
jgi:hypothetical protein